MLLVCKTSLCQTSADKGALIVWFNGSESVEEATKKITEHEREQIPIDAVDNLGKTALFYAIQSSRPDLVDMLLKAGSKKIIDDSYTGGTLGLHSGDTPLHYAVGAFGPYPDRQKDIITSLINSGADVRAKNKDGDEPMHFLPNFVLTDYTRGWEWRLDILKMLLAHGADINARGNAGDTLLHYTIRVGDVLWAQVMLDLRSLKKEGDSKDYYFSDVLKQYNQRLDASIKNSVILPGFNKPVTRMPMTVRELIEFLMMEAQFNVAPYGYTGPFVSVYTKLGGSSMGND